MACIQHAPLPSVCVSVGRVWLAALVSVAIASVVMAQEELPVVPGVMDTRSQTEQFAQGVVYEDIDRDGVRDPGERGLAGVAVSNGLHVIRTDVNGQYRIPVSDDCQIFVCKPRGMMVPLDEHNKPRFWYTHKPQGSRDEGFHFTGFEPTGDLPDSIDFGLLRRPEPDTFSIIAMGDPQPYSQQEVDWYARDVIEDIINTGLHRTVAFGISLGDLVGDNLDLFGPLDRVQSQPGVPWFNVFGNHDMNFRSTNDWDSDETFERVYGPPTHAFQWGRVHFIVVDNVIWQGFNGYRDSGKIVTNNYRGGLRDDQLAFIENYLQDVSEDDLVVLSMHIPLEGDGVHRVPEQRRLFEILSRFPNTMSMSGHTHLQRHWFFGSEHGYTAGEHHHLNGATGSGSWYRGATDERGIPHSTMRCGAPNGYNIITFDGNRYSMRFKAASEPATAQMRLTVPAPLLVGQSAEVVANVFAGSAKSQVRYRINNNAWLPMTHSPRLDPSLLAIKAIEQSDTPPNGRTIPDPQPSHHIWAANLPTNLPPGVHRVEVESVDMFGHADTDTVLLRVERE